MSEPFELACPSCGGTGVIGTVHILTADEAGKLEAQGFDVQPMGWGVSLTFNEAEWKTLERLAAARGFSDVPEFGQWLLASEIMSSGMDDL